MSTYWLLFYCLCGVEFACMQVYPLFVYVCPVHDLGECMHAMEVAQHATVCIILSVCVCLCVQVFRKVHDIAVDPVNKAVYVAELSPARIWKYSIVTGDTTTASAPTTTTTEMTTETTHSTTHQPPSTTQGPHSTTHQPPSTTHQPPSTTHQPPSATHQPPSTTHQPPSSTTHQPPSSATHQPPSTTHQPPSTTHQPPSATQGPQETTTTDQTTTTLTTTQPNTQPTATETTPETHNTESTDNSTPTSVDISSGSHSDHSTASSESPAYSGDTGGDNAEMTDDNGSLSEAQSSKAAPKKDKMATPAFHYGLFAAIFAIVGLILVVVVGILKEHRFLRFRTRRLVTETPAEGKTSREALHSLLGPSKLGFSRLRTYDSDSEAEEFPIFSRVRCFFLFALSLPPFSACLSIT